MTVRLSCPDDLPSLERLEQASFSSDRFSKSLIQNLMTRERASILVAECQGRVYGAAYMLWKRNTRKARLYSLAVDPANRREGVGACLMAECESETVWRDYACMVLEVRKDNSRASGFYKKLNFVNFKSIPDFYEDGAAAIQMIKVMPAGTAGAAFTVPYFRQTTPFTCGPACLMMAISHFKPHKKAGQLLELNLWKSATLIFMASGIGGACPFGLAIAAMEHGLTARVLSSSERNPFLLTVRNPKKQKIIHLLHEDMKAAARRKNIAAAVYSFNLADIFSYLHRGWLPIVLISTRNLTGFRGPHWVLVTGYDEKSVFIHDPDANSYSENPQMAVNSPVSHQRFQKLLGYGKTRSRYAVFIGPPDPAVL